MSSPPEPGLGARRAYEGHVRVLLVEDDPQCAELVCASLGEASRGSFEVCRAERLESAFEELGQQQFDAMLVDLSQPERSRSSTLDAAGSLKGRLPVIVLTGTEDPEESEAERLRTRLARCELARHILGAIKRHHRFGSAAGDPLVVRI